MANQIMPVGIAWYHHEDDDLDFTEKPVYSSEEDMENGLVSAMDNDFPAKHITLWVAEDHEPFALHLIDLLKAKYGDDRPPVYHLTQDNLDRCIGDFTVTVPVQA